MGSALSKNDGTSSRRGLDARTIIEPEPDQFACTNVHQSSSPTILLVYLTMLLLMTTACADNGRFEWELIPDRAGGTKGTVQLASGEVLAFHERYEDGANEVVCSVSLDRGRTWTNLSVIVRREAARGEVTLGDGHLFQLPTGAVLFSYRNNELAGDASEYAIEVAVSHDRGATWHFHSTVATSRRDRVADPEAQRGLWSSFLFMTNDGRLHCVYDDEDTPYREGFRRHQWLTMRTWDTEIGDWINPVTVSRAHNPDHLSRDGMPTVVELPSGRLICAFETVQTQRPHANLLRYTTSDDGGRTWSWQHEERGLLYASPRGRDYLNVSAWMILLSTGELLCVFATDEDRSTPGRSGDRVSNFFMDIKYVISTDEGATWSRSQPVFTQTHRNYKPGVIELDDGTILVTFADFALEGHRAVLGVPVDGLRRRPS